MLINADVGECGADIDKAIMPNIDMASIACGGHTGDKNSIKETLLIACQNNCLIGAHISYADRKNFGRLSPKNISLEELYTQIENQLEVITNICLNNAAKISYIKAHGALYHDIIEDFDKLKIVLKLANKFAIKKLVTQKNIVISDDYLIKNNIKLLFEVFADRKYINNKILPRASKDAVLQDPAKIIMQYNKLRHTNNDTICFHSDNKASVLALKML